MKTFFLHVIKLMKCKLINVKTSSLGNGEKSKKNSCSAPNYLPNTSLTRPLNHSAYRGMRSTFTFISLWFNVVES